MFQLLCQYLLDSFTEMNGTTLVPALFNVSFQLSGLVITV